MRRLTIAVSLALLALPAVLPAQGAATSSRTAAAASVAVDPWLMVIRGVPRTEAARAARATVRANVARLDDALEPYGARYAELDDTERAGVRAAFDDLVPRQRFSVYRISEPQARAMVFLALGPAESLRPVASCADDDRRGRRGRDRDGNGRDWNRPEPPPPAPPVREQRSAACQSRLDSLSRDAAWINTTIKAMGRTGSNRDRAAEQADLRTMSEMARSMVLSVNRCGCESAAGGADSLMTATRAALDAYNASGMAAWMSIGGVRAAQIANLSESVERTLIRCLSQ